MLFQSPIGMLSDQCRWIILSVVECMENGSVCWGIPQGNSNISKPVLISQTSDRWAFGESVKLLSVPIEQCNQSGGIKTVPRGEVFLLSFTGEPIPWTNQLAIITTKNSVPNHWSKFLGNGSLQFNCQIRYAPSGINNVGCNNCFGGTGTDAGFTLSTVLWFWRINRKWQVCIKFPQKEPRACSAIQ